MATRELGRLEKVDLREAWANESAHFTPSLAKPENRHSSARRSGSISNSRPTSPSGPNGRSSLSGLQGGSMRWFACCRRSSTASLLAGLRTEERSRHEEQA